MFRQDFPILNDINNPVVYLDNGATTQKPQAVINAVRDYYIAENANPLRGLYSLSVKATEAYEKARQSVAKFINAKESCEIIFTRNTTESLNLIAYSYGMNKIQENDEIVISILEHHSNILPWQMVAKAKKATLKYMYTDVEGNISDEEILSKITEKTKIVSITQVSNVLGVKTPLEKIIKRAHAVGAIVVVDGAQGAPHLATDVQKLDCDFYAFSGHKMLAPMGIGVLYGKKSLLEEMPPFLRGGEMIDMVTEQDATFAPLPEKFEAGTPNVSGAIGLKAAIDYLNNVGFDKIEAQEKELIDLAYTELAKIPYVTIYGPKNPALRYGVLSFNIEGVHPHDVSSLVDYHGNIALRAGHHCAQPLLKFLKTPSTNRISFYFYNTKEDVYKFIEQIKQVRKWMGYND
ncbi:Probable cysteine desulfurase [Megamonas hypermegale]|uniref:Cysteine desulfurase n=1 Tax=Megamonas hypermegale TaxID=158847 RepID=A0A239TDI6_9FIRM|nr:cysteine desulfurase [Megamonas hypermegale]SNU95609.1 Probable cysteine desulfurase [Megamonas hypermegale]